MVPSSMLSSADNIGNSRYDIRGISQLFAHLASVPTVGETLEYDCHASMTEFLLPPPPPPPLPQCTVVDNRERNAPIIINLEEHFDVCRTDEVCFESLRNYFDLDNDSSIDSETNYCEVPVLDGIPTDLELAVAVSSETNCIEENIIIDTFDFVDPVEFAVGLPDHLINISGLIKGIGSMPKPFVATVKANMKIEGFAENVADALGLDDHLSKLCGNGFAHTLGLEEHASKFRGEERRRDNFVVSALSSPIYIALEKDPYCSTLSSEDEDKEDYRESN